MASRSLFVAALQTAGIRGDPASTLAQFERQVRALRSTFDGLQLVVTPEPHLMALTSLVNAGWPAKRSSVSSRQRLRTPYETSQPGTRTVCFDIDGIGREAGVGEA